jgi:hypothetical protein
MKALRLKDNYNEPFVLLGLISTESAIKTCWHINNTLNIALSQSEPIYRTTSYSQEYPVFSFTDEEIYLKYSLIINRIDNYQLLPSLKNVDYLLKLTGNTNADFIKNIVIKLRSANVASNIMLIGIDKIKEISILENA